MGTTVVFKQELGTYIPVNNTYVKQFTEKKRRVSSAYSRRSAEIQSGPGALFKCCFWRSDAKETKERMGNRS